MAHKSKNLLLDDRYSTLQFALKKYNKTENDLKGSISNIKNWSKYQNQVPEIPDDNVITNFLLMNKFNIKSTKEKLEMYYFIRTALPDFFKNKHPCLKHMQEVAETMYFIPLPKLTEEGYRVIIIKMVEKKPDTFNAYNFFSHTYNVTEVRLHEDVAIGDICVYDLGNFKIGHFFKLTPTLLRKTTIVLEKVYSNRIKQIHLINSPKYAATTISIVKKVLKPKIATRIHIHKEYASMLKYIPSKILPKEYGGEEMCLVDLNDLWKYKLAEYSDRFNTLEAMRIKDDSKLTSVINDDLFGFDNFRKLDVD